MALATVTLTRIVVLVLVVLVVLVDLVVFFVDLVVVLVAVGVRKDKSRLLSTTKSKRKLSPV